MTVFFSSTLSIACVPSYRWNMEQAANSMIEIRKAETDYRLANGRYGSLDELLREKRIRKSLASGSNHGYKFAIRCSDSAYTAVAVPMVYSSSSYGGTGMLSFYLDESGVIRAADRKGAEASGTDPPLGKEINAERER